MNYFQLSTVPTLEKTAANRLNKAFEHLKKIGKIASKKEFGKVFGADKFRIHYLTKDGGGQLKGEEPALLKKHYPEVNWDWVTSGEGEMLSPPDRIIVMEEPEQLFHKFLGNEEEFRKILSGKSQLPVEVRESILIDEILKLQQRMTQAVELNSKSILEELKGLIGKQK